MFIWIDFMFLCFLYHPKGTKTPTQTQNIFTKIAPSPNSLSLTPDFFCFCSTSSENPMKNSCPEARPTRAPRSHPPRRPFTRAPASRPIMVWSHVGGCLGRPNAHLN